jgi:hypothetical protein
LTEKTHYVMTARRVQFIFFLILSSSFLITLILINITGKSIEKVETQIYQRLTGKFSQHFEYDSLGIPFVVYQGKVGPQYNTVAIAEYAIRLAQEKDTLNSDVFQNCINWLISRSEVLNDSSLILLNRYDWPSYKMSSPWRSAMNQGRAMQAYLVAYEKTSDKLFLDYARKSMNALFTEVKDGGVTYIDSSGYWYEEYADDYAPQSRVLNGMIVVLQALSDYYRVTKDSSACFLFKNGVKSVKHTLHLYDNNGQSNYDVLGKPASFWYHKFHIAQLEFLYNETHEPVFNDYKLNWGNYKEPSYLETLIAKPTRIGIAAILTLFSTVLAALLLPVTLLFLKTKKSKIQC